MEELKSYILNRFDHISLEEWEELKADEYDGDASEISIDDWIEIIKENAEDYEIIPEEYIEFYNNDYLNDMQAYILPGEMIGKIERC